MIRREDIIAEIAKEQNILISRDDPIISFLAVHQKMIDQYADKIGITLEASQQQFTIQLIEAQEKYSNQSRELANEIVGGAVRQINDAEERLVERLNNYTGSEENLIKQYIGQLKSLLIVILTISICSLLISLLELMQ